jgi:hypothetical protein
MRLFVNGIAADVPVEPDRALLEVLRDVPLVPGDRVPSVAT